MLNYSSGLLGMFKNIEFKNCRIWPRNQGTMLSPTSYRRALIFYRIRTMSQLFIGWPMAESSPSNKSTSFKIRSCPNISGITTSTVLLDNSTCTASISRAKTPARIFSVILTFYGDSPRYSILLREPSKSKKNRKNRQKLLLLIPLLRTLRKNLKKIAQNKKEHYDLLAFLIRQEPQKCKNLMKYSPPKLRWNSTVSHACPTNPSEWPFKAVL